MKTIIYVLCALSVILLIALLYTTAKLKNTEMRRKFAVAKADALKAEKRQLKRRLESRPSSPALLSASVVPDGVQSRFDEYEQTITDLEARLAAANAENECLKQLREAPRELPGGIHQRIPVLMEVHNPWA